MTVLVLGVLSVLSVFSVLSVLSVFTVLSMFSAVGLVSTCTATSQQIGEDRDQGQRIDLQGLLQELD